MNCYIIQSTISFTPKYISGVDYDNPVWPTTTWTHERSEAKEFYSHAGAVSFMKEWHIEVITEVVRGPLTIKCRPGVIQ